MRLSLDPEGAIAHTSHEWKTFTGLSDSETLGKTSMMMVHPDDREFVKKIISSAVKIRASYLVHFRIKRPKNVYSWVICGGSPSFSPLRGECLGYLCDTELLTMEPEPAEASDMLGNKAANENQVALLDAVAEHVTIARNIAKQADERSLMNILDLALLSIGDRLFRSTRR